MVKNARVTRKKKKDCKRDTESKLRRYKDGRIERLLKRETGKNCQKYKTRESKKRQCKKKWIIFEEQRKITHINLI